MTAGMKRCSKCRKEKPASAQHFVGDPNRADGLDTWCLTCFNSSSHKERTAHYRLTRPRLQADGKP